MTDPVIPTPIQALPPAPLVTDTPEQFDEKAFPFAEALDGFGQQANQLADQTYQNALYVRQEFDNVVAERIKAEDAAENAMAAAVAAAVNAEAWDVSKTYIEGDVVWSPIDHLSYRRTIDGSGGVDPSLDDTATWVLIGGQPLIVRPSVVSPADGATDVMDGIVFQLSGYYSLYDVPQKATRVQASTNSSFSGIFWDSGDVPLGSNPTIPAGILNTESTYYWRGQYIDDLDNRSGWAMGVFTTAEQFANYIPTPAPTPANFGDAFEGGFYAGMIWNQVAQSSDSKTLATGPTTFTVPDMAGTPIVYSGQQLEIRSRANPDNHFKCVVTGALGTQLSVNVTATSGSGTFSDWSVMSRFRIIDAPKSSGDNPGIALKNTSTELPAACQTLTEGWEATLAMVAAGDATTYPAAHWARGLTINGFIDWYIPARDELELSWRNLKPTTDNNYTSRADSTTYNYQNNGAYGDVNARANGENLNSYPQGVAYTATNPAQTTSQAFRTGGLEAMEYGSVFYWSSSDYGTVSAWCQYWDSRNPSYQSYNTKGSTARARAVRRSII